MYYLCTMKNEIIIKSKTKGEFKVLVDKED